MNARSEEPGVNDEPFGEKPCKAATKNPFGQVNPDAFAVALADMKRRILPNNPDKVITLASWNEWSEGSCLEPSLEHGHKFLEALL